MTLGQVSRLHRPVVHLGRRQIVRVPRSHELGIVAVIPQTLAIGCHPARPGTGDDQVASVLADQLLEFPVGFPEGALTAEIGASCAAIQKRSRGRWKSG